ncbi:unnamed protein product [Rhizophagus irregularis]|nr:unnamed protein product [Rhizophagus irregularis]
MVLNQQQQRSGQGKIRCNRKGNIEFSVVELEFMEEDYKTILQDPDLEEEVYLRYYKWGESFCPLSRSANFEKTESMSRRK